ncbi:MAG: nucleotidyltransferase domain-containing protein [Xanthomonadales bacterium]|nr:nucleotidyltransferase domain-containing protein [Xanthomonadales bacterium]
MRAADPLLQDAINAALAALPALRLVIVFGSCASQRQRPDSDLDIAVHAGRALTGDGKIALIDALACTLGRAVDLVDLHSCGEPLLGEILEHGRLVCGDIDVLANLMVQHVVAHSDFIPYRDRILAARRNAWIGQ